MKATVKVLVEKEFDVRFVRMVLPIRHLEDIPESFPHEKMAGEAISLKVDIDSGKIVDWPIGASCKLVLKVVDAGSYTLFDSEGNVVARRVQDYVPNDLIPGEYGDYVNLHILEDGTIKNWPRHPSIDEFFSRDED